jgi:hypothetical protein
VAGAPDITLTAVGSGRSFSLQAPGAITLLICVAQETEKDALAVEDSIRARFPSAADVLVVDVIDLRSVPAPFRKIAEGMLASEYRKAVDALADGQQADDYVIILPDWQGDVATAFNLPEPSQSVGGAVLSADGEVMGTWVGTNTDNVMMLLDYAYTH